MPTYHSKRPKDCPLVNSAPHTGKLYRGVRKSTITAIDFLSHAERPKSKCNREECKSWGLSVWVNIDDVHFARGISSFLRTDRCIAEGDIGANDGCILKTPTNDQDNHYTFWKDISVDFVPRFKVIIEPAGDEE